MRLQLHSRGNWKDTVQNIINPLAAIGAAGMMLETLGETEAAKTIENAIIDVVNNNLKSLSAGKMGYGTKEVGDLVVAKVMA